MVFLTLGPAKQILSVLVAACGFANVGFIFSYPSVVISDIVRHKPNIYGKEMALTSTEKDLIGSLIGLGAIVGAGFLPFTTTVFGRKFHLLFIQVVAFIAWMGIALSPSVESILLFRFISGSVYGAFSISYIYYCVEVADSNVRGLFASFSGLLAVAGQMAMAVIDYLLPYYSVAFFCAAFVTMNFICMLFIPESPRYRFIQGDIDNAKEILYSIRSVGTDIDKEIEMYREMNAESKEKNVWQGIRSPAILKRMAIVITVFFLRTFGGFEVLVANSFRIFKSFDKDIDESIARIILFSAQVPSSLIMSFFMVDRLGRRKTLMISCFIISLSFMYMSAHIFIRGSASDVDNKILQEGDSVIVNGTMNNTEYNQESLRDVATVLQEDKMGYANGTINITAYNQESVNEQPQNLFWSYLPVAIVTLCLSGFYLGLQTVPFVLMAEYFPTWIRPQAAAICGFTNNCIQFTALQLYTPLVTLLTTGGYYFFLSVLVGSGIPFTYFFVREMMGAEIG